MKKYLMLLLILVVLFTGFPIYGPTPTVEAARSNSDSKAYPTGAWFEDGKLIFVTWNKKASSATRYRTVGFVLRADTTCDSGSRTAQCTPMRDDNGNGQPDEYMDITLIEMQSEPNVNECQYIKDTLPQYASDSLSSISSDTGCTLPGFAK